MIPRVQTKVLKQAKGRTMAEAGWYPDADDSSLARWWDGERWSDERKPLAEMLRPAQPERAPAISLSNAVPIAGETGGQRNAREMAARYLNSMSFSRDGLIDQLLHSKFSRAQAEYGVSTTGL